MDDRSKGIKDYIAVARRRKWYIILPATAIFFLSIFLALAWPPTYLSTATILIEQPEIPPDLINSENAPTQVADYVERRIEAISRRVLVSDNLARIIGQYNLYVSDRQKRPMSDVIDDMRDDITLDIVNTNVVAANGQATTAAVAFTLAFKYQDAATTQRVTNELVSLYLNENLKQRRDRATQTAAFLTQERERTDQSIEELSRGLTDFRQANAGSLPEDGMFNQQALMRIEPQIAELSGQLQGLREREAYLAQQVSMVQPYQLGSSGGVSLSPQGQLMSMQTDLATLRGRYGADHPDVLRLTRQVTSLQQSQGIKGDAALERDRATAQQQLDQLTQRYTPDHPDVQRARRTLASLDAQLASSNAKGNKTPPDNPVYIDLQSQLQSVRSQIPSLTDQLAGANKQLAQFQMLASKTPAIQGQYDKLQHSLEEATERRNELAQREMTAVLSQNVETELKGERFSLIEPPDYPNRPASPHRILMVALGMVLAVGAGAGLVTVTHLLDDGIYVSDDVLAIVGEPPLAIIPHIETRAERLKIWSLRGLYVLVLLVLIGSVGWFVNERIMPLDVLAYSIGQGLSGTVQSLVNPAPVPSTAPLGQ